MIYALKVIEFVVLAVYITALAGAYFKFKDESAPDRLENAIIGFLSVSALLHLINLFR